MDQTYPQRLWGLPLQVHSPEQWGKIESLRVSAPFFSFFSFSPQRPSSTRNDDSGGGGDNKRGRGKERGREKNYSIYVTHPLYLVLLYLPNLSGTDSVAGLSLSLSLHLFFSLFILSLSFSNMAAGTRHTPTAVGASIKKQQEQQQR